MTPCGRRLKWSGGTHDFDLGNDRVLKILSGDMMGGLPIPFVFRRNYSREPLAGQFGATPAAALKRFQEAVYSVQDVECIMELGLWGGGLPSADVLDLSDRHIRGQPLAASATIAFEVLAALFVGAKNASAAA